MTASPYKTAIAALLLAGLTACSDPPGHPAREPIEHQLPTYHVVIEPLVLEHQSVGTVVSDERVEISSRLPAYVRAIQVREGERIRKGQLLMKLDARDQEAAVQQAQAKGAMREAELRDAVRALSDTQTLFKRGLVADSMRRKAQLQHDIAEQALHTQQAALDAARAQLRYSEIVSPVDGVVAQRPARNGDLVTPGKPLLIVESDTALLFETAVAESRIQQITEGDRARVSIDATQQSYPATVVRVLPSGDPVTRRFTVKLQFDNTQGLTPGLFGRARFTLGESDGLQVPDSALAQRGGLTGVFVLGQDRELNFRWVRTGRRIAGQTEITAGLKPGETIVSDNHDSVRDGDRMKAETP